jgi:hypothetical protein
LGRALPGGTVVPGPADDLAAASSGEPIAGAVAPITASEAPGQAAELEDQHKDEQPQAEQRHETAAR